MLRTESTKITRFQDTSDDIDEIYGPMVPRSDGTQLVGSTRPDLPEVQWTIEPENRPKLKSIASDESWPGPLADCGLSSFSRSLLGR